MIDSENILLPIQFCIDPGENFNFTAYDGREGNWALSDVEHIALLKEYLEIVYASPAASPDEELYDDQSDEDYEKKIIDMAITLNNEDNNLAAVAGAAQQNKSKAAKQLQIVAKQFGSIGKSVGKKIKKNIGSITKFGGKNSGQSQAKSNPTISVPSLAGSYVNGKFRMLCAQLKAKRHIIQEEMIKNYLDCAQDRFLKELKDVESKDTSAERYENSMIKTPSDRDEVDCIAHCINSGCTEYGTSRTSYMCLECYDKQKKREIVDYAYQPPRYGTGNSKFYTQSTLDSHETIKRLPSMKRLSDLDQVKCFDLIHF